MDNEEWQARRKFAAENPFEAVHLKGYLPKAAAVDKNIKTNSEYSYYVVSYSREDSQYVLPEIFDLQKAGFEIWYDHGIVDRVTADNDWRKIVNDRISDFHCRGVLFYISENFVLSPSIEEEVRIVKEANKPHLEIALPMTEIGHKRSYYQAGRIAEIEREFKSEKILVARGLGTERVKLYKEMFDDSVNFIKYSAPMEERINGLNGMKKPELFEFGEIIGGDAEIIAVNDINVTDVEIPSKAFISDNEYRVTRIGTCAFANCRKLESVRVPGSVIEIGNYAFYRCRSLREIDLPKNMDVIESHAFDGCCDLSVIELPKALKYIMNSVFSNCDDLKEIVMPDNVMFVYDYAFCNCGSLTRVKIGNSVKRIGGSVFYECENLSSVELGNNVEQIGEWAFFRCKSLQSIDIPDSVRDLDFCSFAGSGLRHVKLGRGLSAISVGAFYNSALERIEIPENIKVIEDGAFKMCYELRGVKLSNGLTEIEREGFLYCRELNNIVIPDSVRKIGEDAFRGCSSLSCVEFGNGLSSIGKGAFYDCLLEYVRFGSKVRKCVYYVNLQDDHSAECSDDNSWSEAIECELNINDEEKAADLLSCGYELKLYY